MEIEESKVQPVEEEQEGHLLSDEAKWFIVHYKKQNMSNKQTAFIVGEECHRLSISHQTVKSVWSKYQDTRTVNNFWNEKGRPKVVEEDDMEDLIEYFDNNPKKSVNNAKSSLGIVASRETINRALREQGLKAYRSPKKFYITEVNIEKRLDFSLHMQRKEFNYWKKVIFSDESNFPLMNPNGRLLIRRNIDQEQSEDDIQETRQCESLMVWGAISSKGVGPLMRIDKIEEGETTLNGERYLMILQRYLLRNYPDLKIGKAVFQHDNAPSHRYGKVNDWLEEKNVTKIDWPPQSPDMNIIENIWGKIKFEIRGEAFEDKDQLWRRVKKEWDSISDELILNLYQSMPDRILALKEAGGKHTKY